MKNLRTNIGTILLGILVALQIVVVYLKISSVESKIPTNYIPRIEYELKDQMIRESIHNIFDDIREIEKELEQLQEEK